MGMNQQPTKDPKKSARDLILLVGGFVAFIWLVHMCTGRTG